MARETTEAESLQRMLDCLGQAAGCAHQLAHQQQNPTWLRVRDNLEAMRGVVTILATQRALSRQQVLAALDARQLARA